MRILGVDYGRRRIGLALSDHSATLASPWRVVPVALGATPATSAGELASIVAASGARPDEDLDIGAIVVGLPRRLNGEDTDQTQPARDFAEHLAALTGLDVHLQDERLTSREAESRLAAQEKDWRKRKARLDAASAAVILQDYLDSRARGRS
ncbi:MAG TPA: Holliday junction resolvase RuvX [Vicinamibacterales bacterium]|jgi:putative Holliday junction resolvase